MQTETISNEIRRTELMNFLNRIPFIKRMIILQPVANKYSRSKDPVEYIRRIKRSRINDEEVLEIIESATNEGYGPDYFKRLKQEADQAIKTLQGI